MIECNTSSNILTVKLAATPIAGQIFTILDAYGTTGGMTGFPITIDGNGNKINGSLSPVVISTNYQCLVLRYAAGSAQWTIMGKTP